MRRPCSRVDALGKELHVIWRSVLYNDRSYHPNDVLLECLTMHRMALALEVMEVVSIFELQL